MDVKNIDILDKDSGFILCNGLVAISLFEGYTWFFDEIQNDSAVGSIITAIDPENNEEICNILIADATNDNYEPDISKLSIKDVKSLSNDLMEGVSATFNSSHQEVLSFSESKLVFSNMRRFLLTDYMVRENGIINKYAAYRTSVNGRKLVIQSNHPLSEDKTIEHKLYTAIDNAKFIDNDSDCDFINQFTYIPQVVTIEGFRLPIQVRGFDRVGDVVDYEKQTPGMGHSVAYSSIIGEATVYVYNDRQVDIPEDIMDQAIAEHFNTQFNLIEDSLNNNNISIDNVDEPYVLNCGTASVICITFITVTENDERQSSCLYLSTLNNQYVKIRITSQFVMDSTDDFDNFVCELIQKMTGAYRSIIKTVQYLDLT